MDTPTTILRMVPRPRTVVCEGGQSSAQRAKLSVIVI